MTKSQTHKILFLTIFWESCFLFILFFEGVVTDYKPMSPEAIPFTLHTLLPAIMISIIGASLTASFEVMIFSKIFRKMPFGKVLLYKTSFYLFNMLFWFSVIVIIKTSTEFGKPIYDEVIIESYLKFLFSQRNIILIIYWGFVTFLGLFTLQISDKFGQGILINFLFGKYHQPKVENRIFLFMDLKSSTTIAEKLGHIKYSQLIQDCYYDLTEILIKYHAQIYQYVGDEVILTWKINDGLKENNCLNVFFAYDKLIIRKGEYYSKKYGLIPEFKAGLNIGEVTVAEVGELKKELAYHGDVLNTAARIQGKCNEFQKRVLISESLKIQFEAQSEFDFELIDNIRLKGKEESLNIYDVKPLIVD